LHINDIESGRRKLALTHPARLQQRSGVGASAARGALLPHLERRLGPLLLAARHMAPKLFNPFAESEEAAAPAFGFYSDPLAAFSQQPPPRANRGGNNKPQPPAGASAVAPI
jgi:hypothetical protein